MSRIAPTFAKLRDQKRKALIPYITAGFPYADITPELKSQKASSFSFVPFIGGLGRGYTSNTLLEEDRRTVEAHANRAARQLQVAHGVLVHR